MSRARSSSIWDQRQSQSQSTSPRSNSSGVPPASLSPPPPTSPVSYPTTTSGRSPIPIPGHLEESTTEEYSPWSSRDSLRVNSTVPPCQPQLPPSPRTQPISPSILLNPLPPQSTSPNSSTAEKILKKLPGRRQSIQVEVHHSPPPAHFYQDPNHQHLLDPEDLHDQRLGRTETRESLSTFTSDMSPPRPQLAGLRSRSASPLHTPRSHSPVQQHEQPSTSTSTLAPPPPPSSSNASTSTEFTPLSSIISQTSTSTSASTQSSTSTRSSSSPGIRFAPLPPGKRAMRCGNHRSNSISLGVASRARMINAQGGQPNVQQARYAGPLQWYEGGDMPQDVYTWRDAQKGLSKIWKRVSTSNSSDKSSVASTSPSSISSTSPPPPSQQFPPLMSTTTTNGSSIASTSTSSPVARGRSLSSTSTTSSGGNVEESKRMEREAKSGLKGEVEHVEEARIVEENIEEDEAEEGDEGGGLLSSGGDYETSESSELTAPMTPPPELEGMGALGLTNVGEDDVELLEKERRRIEKGKGKEGAVVDDQQHIERSSVRVV